MTPKPRQTLSVATITFNSERSLERTLEGVKWADEIVVVDDYSVDKTLDIASTFHAKIFQNKFEGFSAQKQLAVDKCSSDWVLVLDDDEYLSDELSDEIKNVLENGSNYSAYKLPRTLLFLGKVLKVGNESRRPVLRLFKRNAARFNSKLVHEGLEVQDQNIGTLKHDMLHDSFASYDECIKKMDRYALLWAKEKSTKGKTVSWLKLKTKYAVSFIQVYILGLQFLNGKQGLQWSQCTAFYNQQKYQYLQDMNKS